MIKLLKLLGTKIIYLMIFLTLFIVILLLFLNIFRKYYSTFNLSQEINLYLQNVALEKVQTDKAVEVIEFLKPTSTTALEIGNLENPFKLISKEAEE